MAQDSYRAYLEQLEAARREQRAAEQREAQAEAKQRNASRGN